jgi:hypothetical protein
MGSSPKNLAENSTPHSKSRAVRRTMTGFKPMKIGTISFKEIVKIFQNTS